MYGKPKLSKPIRYGALRRAYSMSKREIETLDTAGTHRISTTNSESKTSVKEGTSIRMGPACHCASHQAGNIGAQDSPKYNKKWIARSITRKHEMLGRAKSPPPPRSPGATDNESRLDEREVNYLAKGLPKSPP